MKFCELNRDEYHEFQQNHRYCNFLNAPETMDLEEAVGWKTHYVGMKKNGKVLCATPLVQMPIMRKFHYFYSPRGLLIDFDNKDLVRTFTKELKAYAKRKKAMYIVVDPYVLYKERDIHGELVDGGFDHSDIVEVLKSQGYLHQGFSVGYGHTMQFIRWMFSLSLVDKTTEGIWKDLHQQTRWSINKTLKTNILVRELGYDELDVFNTIMEHTSERRNFENRDVVFYQKQYKSYGEHLKVLLAYMDVDIYVESIDKEYQKEQEEKVQILQELEKNPNSKKFIKKQRVNDEAIEIALKRKQEALKLKEQYGNQIPMATSMFVFYKDEVTYLTSGAYSKFKGFYASYALQWYVIQKALSEGYKKYNFYGISGEFDESSPNYGVYKFKQGFGGQVEELVGDFILVTRPLLYKVYKFLKR